MGVNKRLSEKHGMVPLRAGAPAPGAKPATPPKPGTAAVGKEKPPKPSTDKKADGAGRGRKSPFEGKRVYKKVKECPYRKDSIREATWNKIKDGMKYEDLMKADGDAFAVKYGVLKEHYQVK